MSSDLYQHTLNEFIYGIEEKKNWDLSELKIKEHYNENSINSKPELYSDEIGTHISKRKLFYESLVGFYEKDPVNKKKPVQIFTGSPKFWKRPDRREDDIKKTRDYISENKFRVYTHSIYLINLSKSSEEFMQKAYNCIVSELTLGADMGFQGVVVHCGKSLKIDLSTALDNMYNNILTIYDKINSNNPLLIETSSGQGSEVCWNIEAFKEFYSRFTVEQQSKIKICVDTCHIFAAGHIPLDYLINWDSWFPGSIALVHYNDSKEGLGKKKDRHAYPGEGCIGKEHMDSIAKWCLKKYIPMIIE